MDHYKRAISFVRLFIYFVLCASCLSCASGTTWSRIVKRNTHSHYHQICGSKMHSCSSGECIPEEKVCDGREDCQDGSDEGSCHYISCSSPFLFRCAYGGCVNRLKVCDGRIDCKDKSDEEACAVAGDNSYNAKPVKKINEQKCSSGFEKCNSGECIEERSFCDGKKDCEDGSDESNTCRGYPCNRRSGFRCAYGACIRKHLRCDGKGDCKDNSDEENCENVNNQSAGDKRPDTDNQGSSNKCGKYLLKCSSGECLSADLFCDGKEDCQDGSDEEGCQHMRCASPFLFRCSYGACIESNMVCDGKKDCKDNSDEQNCKQLQNILQSNVYPHQKCGTNQFQCKSGQCVDEICICDGVADCLDNSDETEELCKYLKCPGFTYRCSYGACVSSTAPCNGVKDCFDGSDELSCIDKRDSCCKN